MPNANYRAGARLERLWIAQKRAQGYKVIRSAGSHGLIDCMAWNENEIIMAQLKNGKAAYNDDDIADLLEMPRPPSARVLLVVRSVTAHTDWDEIEC